MIFIFCVANLLYCEGIFIKFLIKYRFILRSLCVIFAEPFMKSKVQNMPKEVKPPVAKIVPKTLEKFGDERIDNYFWLNDSENPEVID